MATEKVTKKLSREGRAQAPRGDETRERIVAAAIGVFGVHGFAGASTRMLAQAAGVNIQAIQYYFDNKQGLYLAAADYIGEKVGGTLGTAASATRERLAAKLAGNLSQNEVRALLVGVLQQMAKLVVSEESGPWARFMIREQMEPTEAFERVYANFMQPTLATLRRLVGVLLEDDPQSEHVGMRTLATIGHVLFFRFARAAVMRQLDWEAIGERELEVLNRLIEETVAGIAPVASRKGAP